MEAPLGSRALSVQGTNPPPHTPSVQWGCWAGHLWVGGSHPSGCDRAGHRSWETTALSWLGRWTAITWHLPQVLPRSGGANAPSEDSSLGQGPGLFPGDSRAWLQVGSLDSTLILQAGISHGAGMGPGSWAGPWAQPSHRNTAGGLTPPGLTGPTLALPRTCGSCQLPAKHDPNPQTQSA